MRDAKAADNGTEPLTEGGAPAGGAVAVTYRIHPGVGVVRLGDSQQRVFRWPGSAWLAAAAGGWLQGRQWEGEAPGGALRIYEYGPDGIHEREVTGFEASITWTVHLANKKGAWFKFVGRYKWQDPANRVLRNEEVESAPEHIVDPDLRTDLVINPGPRSITGISQPPVPFDTGAFRRHPRLPGRASDRRARPTPRVRRPWREHVGGRKQSGDELREQRRLARRRGRRSHHGDSDPLGRAVVHRRAGVGHRDATEVHARPRLPRDARRRRPRGSRSISDGRTRRGTSSSTETCSPSCSSAPPTTGGSTPPPTEADAEPAAGNFFRRKRSSACGIPLTPQSRRVGRCSSSAPRRARWAKTRRGSGPPGTSCRSPPATAANRWSATPRRGSACFRRSTES